jgi:hypothetical protein
VPSSSFARRSAAALACGAGLLLSACQVTTGVTVDTRADGSGTVRATVTLDRDAVAQAGDLASRLRVDDLKRTGWRVDGPKAVKGGGQEVQAVKRFATPAEASVVVEQLAGKDGPFRQFKVVRDRSFLKTRLTFRGEVDLSRGLGSFSDEQLRARLGSDLGFDPAALEGRLGRAISRVFPVRVAARLPGSVTSNAPLDAANGAVWSPQFGEHVTLRASSEAWNKANVAGAVGAVVFGLALAGLLAWRVLGRRLLGTRLPR